MIVHRCDRCGVEIDVAAEPIVITLNNGFEKMVIIKYYNYDRALDLCQSCLKSFSKWFSKCLPPVEDTILGRQEDLSDPHPQETK